MPLTKLQFFIALKAQHGFWQDGNQRRCTCGFSHHAPNAFKAWPRERKHLQEKLNEQKP